MQRTVMGFVFICDLPSKQLWFGWNHLTSDELDNGQPGAQ